MSATANDRILHAAIELMAERGIAGITMSAVASAANVARQTLYNHYPDVESVVFAATNAHQRESIEHLTQVLSTIDSPSSRIEHLVRHAAALAAHGHPSVRDGFSPQVAELLVAHDHEQRRLIATALRDGMARREFREDIDVERDSVLLQRMIEAVGELVAASPDETTAVVVTAVRSALGAVQAPAREPTAAADRGTRTP